MQSFSVLLGLASLASVALAHIVVKPVDGSADVSARNTWMIEYCASTGLSGSCGQDPSDNVNICVDTFTGCTSVKVFDGFSCTLYSGAGCSGSSETRSAATWPDVGMTVNSFQCSSA